MHHRYPPLLLVLVALFASPGLTAARTARQTDAGLPSAAPGAGLAARADAADFPRYDLSIDVDTAARTLTGHEHLQFKNRTGAALADIVLRLYPNFPEDMLGSGGDTRMDLSNVRVAGAPASMRYEAGRTAARIALATELQPGAEVGLDLDWRATIRQWQRSEGSFPLPSYYPMLAAWTGGWRTDVTRFPDHVFAAAAIYHATLTVPAGLRVISSGSTVATRPSGSRTTFEAVTEPVREFAFSVGRFAAEHAAYDGIAVNVYHRPGDGMDGVAHQVALHAAASIATYNDSFGRYPYRELDFHLIRAQRDYVDGIEYPGLIYLMVGGGYTSDTRFVVAHETAHQWWYGAVGDDIFREPWLDEGFAQWSPLLVEERYAGAAAAQRVYQQQIARASARTTTPCGLSLSAYGSWANYFHSVYGRCGQFLYTLRRQIGDDAFFQALRGYYAKHAYGIGTTVEIRAAFEAASGRDLGALFRTWTGR